MFNNISQIYDYFDTSGSAFLNRIFILISILLGTSIFFFPVYSVLIGFLAIVISLFLIINPKYCFYLLIFTIPFADHFWYFGGFPVGIALHDIFVVLSIIAMVSSIIIKDEKVDFSSCINNWFLILIPLYLYAGFSSTNFDKGILVAAKFVEAICVYFLAVYYIRTNKVSISNTLNTLMFTALIQSTLAVLQALTGSFGCNNASERGYFGFLGFGPIEVFQGTGSFDHFATLGYFLLALLAFYLPFYRFIVVNKNMGKYLMGIMIFAIVISYSRGALSGLILLLLYFLFYSVENKKKLLMTIIPLGIVILGILIFLMNSNYASTLNLRNDIWEMHWAYIVNHPEKLSLGSGLSSIADTVWQYMPQTEHSTSFKSWSPHNLCLWYLEEMGIVGLVIIVGFFISNFIWSFVKAFSKYKLMRVKYLSIHLVLLTVFYSGINDQVYHEPFMIIFLMLLLGIVYAKNKQIPIRDI